MSSEAIALERVTFRYGQRVALQEVSFSVPAGTVYSLLGPNGAGKSTTLKILRGRLRPLSGEATVLGQAPWSASADWRAQVGWMGEQPGHYERLSVRSNLLFFGRILGVATSEVDRMLAMVSLQDRSGEVVRNLSQGMRQRLALARALLGEPRVLYLDEPTAGLDLVAARNVRLIIRDYVGRGGTVLLTTHDLREAEGLSDCVGILEQGRLRGSKSPSEWCREVLNAELPAPAERVSLEAVYWKLQDGPP